MSHHHEHELINSMSDDEFDQMLDNKLMDHEDEDNSDDENISNPLLYNNNNTTTTTPNMNTPNNNNNNNTDNNTLRSEQELKIDSSSGNTTKKATTGSIIVGGGSFVRNKENSSSSTLNNNSIHLLQTKYQLIIEHLRIILLNNTYLYWIYYITMISLCIILLVWSIIQQGRPHNSDKSIYELFLSIEGIITIILILEILVRIFVLYNGQILTYLFDDFINWFDLIVSMFCIIGFILYLVTVNRFEERIEELIDSLLITFRFVTQTFRIISLIRNHRKAKQQQDDQQFIDLSNSEPIPLMEINLMDTSNHGIINHHDEDEDDMDEHMSNHHHQHDTDDEDNHHQHV